MNHGVGMRKTVMLKDMVYATYFDLMRNGFTTWSGATIPLVMLVGGCVLFYFRNDIQKFNQKIFPVKAPAYLSLQRFVYGNKFMYFWFGGVIILGSLGFLGGYWEYHTAIDQVKSGNVSVVEGTIDSYKAGTNARGSAWDDFCVKDVCFEVSDYRVTNGFHQMQINGSPLKLGTPVRISYVHGTAFDDNLIVRLEIGTHN